MSVPSVPSNSGVAVEPHEPIATPRGRGSCCQPFKHALHMDCYLLLRSCRHRALAFDDTCCLAYLRNTDRPYFYKAIVFFLKKLALTLGPCFFKHLLLDEFPIELKLAVVVRYETIFKMLYPI